MYPSEPSSLRSTAQCCASNAQAERPVEPARSTLLLGSHHRISRVFPVASKLVDSHRCWLSVEPDCTMEGISPPALLDYLVGAPEDRHRNRQAERARGLQIDDELELGRLLDRQLARLRAFEDLVDVDGGSPR
jgi:hypothetical protein